MEHVSSSPLQYYRMGTDSVKISLSCQTVKFPLRLASGQLESSTWQAGQTPSVKNGLGAEGSGCQLAGVAKACSFPGGGAPPQSGATAETRPVFSLAPTRSAQSCVNNTGCQRDGTRM